MKRIKDEEKFLQLLERYSPAGQNYAQLLLDIETRTVGGDMIVPVLGTQGMGKSTIINAILGEDILPNEADETTCVPVEVRYSKEAHGEVHFADHRPAEAVTTKFDLSQYVDNNYNRGNNKGVSHIVLYRDFPLLKSGMVIVDLPGVGSLTKANEETTNRYIQQLCVALFIISTSPPILDSEASFIMAVWRRFNFVYFVQNVWDDNTPEEVHAGLEYNQKILDGISQKIHAPIQNPIIPVNAYAAAKGAFDHNEDLVQKSNIGKLFSALEEFVSHYRQKSEEALIARALEFRNAAVAQIDSSIQKAKMTNEELLNALAQEEKQFADTSAEIEEKMNAVKLQLDRDKRAVRHFSAEIALKYGELLRTEIFHLIDQSVVDGSHLSTAFNNYQTQYASDAMDEVYEEFSKLWDNLQKELEELGEILNRESMSSLDAQAFNKAQSFKWEKGMEAAIRFGSSLGGTAIALFSSLTGPVGFAAGLAVAFIGNLIAGASRRQVVRARAQETKSQIAPYVTAFQTELEHTITDSYTKFYNQTIDQLTGYRKAREDQLAQIQQSIADLKERGKRANADLDLFIQDRQFLANWGADHA